MLYYKQNFERRYIMKFAEIFKSLRKDKELTQEQLAEVLGVSPQQ